MLEDTELHLRSLAHLHRYTPQSSQKMQTGNQRLVAAQAESGIQCEVVVWLGGLTIKRIAINQVETDVWIALSTEQRIVVCEVSITCRCREAHRTALVIVIFIIFASHSPGIATQDSIQSPDRTDEGAQKFPHETRETRQAVIKHQIAHTMRHLSDGNTAESSSHQVVDGRRFYLAGSLPHQTSTEGVWHRFPEIHAMTSCSIEIESAMIWMGKQISRELVVIPDKSRFYIVLDAMKGNLGKLLVHHKLVEALHTHIDGKSFQGSLPRMLFLSLRIIEGKNGSFLPCLHFIFVLLLGRDICKR